MYHFFSKAALLYCLLCVVSETVGDEHLLTCGRRKVKSVYLIHNGANAKAGHWPWHAAIFHRKGAQNEYACGGSILDENTILTAAHCVFKEGNKIPLKQIVVHLGKIDLNEENEYTQTHSLQEIIVHPKFSSASIINDIALIKLSTNITMSKHVQPVCLWNMDSNQEFIVGKNGTVVGFGLNERDVVSERLKQALIGVVDALTCIADDRAVFGTHLTSEMFCGKGQTGVSACNGDSGGGLFFEISGKWFVRGVVSFTPLRDDSRLCDPLKYTAYSDVAKYLEWITPYIDQRVLSHESDVLQIDYEEKLRLFNFETCGVKSSNLRDYRNATWSLPWIGFARSYKHSEHISRAKCIVTLISDWYAIGPAHCFENDGEELLISFGSSNMFSVVICSNCETQKYYKTQNLPIRKIIPHPRYDSNNVANNIVLIELLQPADTTQPNVKPICISAIPELRLNQMNNLSVATYLNDLFAYDTQTIHLTNTSDCVKQYADKGFTIDWQNKRFCAQVQISNNSSCDSLKSGSPLQELRLLGKTERYFLRGFDVFGLACSTGTPTVYTNIDNYLDWILYNMRYKYVATTDAVRISTEETQKPTLVSEWSALQKQSQREKLRLFNMNSCGLILKLYNYLIKNGTVVPWIGFLMAKENRKDDSDSTPSLVVLISEWYALAPKLSVQNDVKRYVMLGSYNPEEPHSCLTSSVCKGTHQKVHIKNIIIPPPDHPRQLFVLIELLESADLEKPFIKPICLPLMDMLHLPKPTEVSISFGKGFAIQSKRLTMIDYHSCQQRLLLESFSTPLNKNLSCAIQMEKYNQIRLAATLGSLVQLPLQLDGRSRSFLYGMVANESHIFENLIYGPYLFEPITLPDLEWIVENVRDKERQTLFLSESPIERVNLEPVQHDSKWTLFNFNTCGESSCCHPLPWLGKVFSNPPFFNVSRCWVTLISEWYAVGPANCIDDDSQELFIQFGARSDTTEMYCSETNISKPCNFPTQEIATMMIFIHPQYNISNHGNDIALLKLARPVDTSRPNVKPICLPLIDSIRSYDTLNLKMDTLIINSGFFNLSEYFRPDIDEGFIDPVECYKRWQGLKVNFNIDRTKLCMIGQEKAESSCLEIFPGASLYTIQKLDSSNRSFLRGFAVIPPIDCSIYYPIVYTNVDAYLDWILETMEQPA
uniref:Peptidase S1 domain-containing protein n=1 Tax=Anopheles christyi TaxID=43041 RepID=A0A182K4L0_9DIPT